jgi:mRNA interferase MazF
MVRGDIITVSLAGDYGKPRPAVVVQSDIFRSWPSVTVLPMTSDILGATTTRVPLEPTSENGLRKRSEVMVDKAHTVPRERTGSVIGRLASQQMTEVDRALAAFLGLV